MTGPSRPASSGVSTTTRSTCSSCTSNPAPDESTSPRGAKRRYDDACPAANSAPAVRRAMSASAGLSRVSPNTVRTRATTTPPHTGHVRTATVDRVFNSGCTRTCSLRGRRHGSLPFSPRHFPPTTFAIAAALHVGHSGRSASACNARTSRCRDGVMVMMIFGSGSWRTAGCIAFHVLFPCSSSLSWYHTPNSSHHASPMLMPWTLLGSDDAAQWTTRPPPPPPRGASKCSVRSFQFCVRMPGPSPERSARLAAGNSPDLPSPMRQSRLTCVGVTPTMSASPPHRSGSRAAMQKTSVSDLSLPHPRPASCDVTNSAPGVHNCPGLAFHSHESRSIAASERDRRGNPATASPRAHEYTSADDHRPDEMRSY